MDLRDLYKDIDSYLEKEVTLEGWIRNHRDQKTFGFIDFSDGTHQKNLQVVYSDNLANFNEIQKLLVGCAIRVKGTIVKSNGNQAYEVQASEVTLLGDCPEDYPIQPKRHTREFLRDVAYLRPRTNLFQAVFRTAHPKSGRPHVQASLTVNPRYPAAKADDIPLLTSSSDMARDFPSSPDHRSALRYTPGNDPAHTVPGLKPSSPRSLRP